MSDLPSMTVALGAFVTVPATLLVVSLFFAWAHWAKRRAVVRASRHQAPPPVSWGAALTPDRPRA